LVHAIIVAMARVNCDQKYKSYRNGSCLKQNEQDLLSASVSELRNGGSFKELEQFQKYLSTYKIIMDNGLSPGRVIFIGNSLSNKKLYLLHSAGHFNVITNLEA
jgi:hypothetical protein